MKAATLVLAKQHSELYTPACLAARPVFIFFPVLRFDVERFGVITTLAMNRQITTPVDLIFGSHSELRVIAEVYVAVQRKGAGGSKITL